MEDVSDPLKPKKTALFIILAEKENLLFNLALKRSNL
jgi:hypothetical protein